MSFLLELSVVRTAAIANFQSELRNILSRSKSPAAEELVPGNLIYDDFSIQKYARDIDFSSLSPGDAYFYTDTNSVVVNAYRELGQVEKSIVDNDLSLRGIYFLLSSSLDSSACSYIAVCSKNVRINEYGPTRSLVIDLPGDDS